MLPRRYHEVKRLIGVGVVDDVRLGAANPRGKHRPIAAQAAQRHAGRIDQTNAIADFAPVAALQLRHQRHEQAGKDFNRTRCVGGRQCRPRYGTSPKMIEFAGVASKIRFDLAQAPRPAKLRIQHRNQVGLAFQPARIRIRIVPFHKTVKKPPGNLLQNAMKNDILVLHGLGPFSRPVDSQPSGIE